MTLEIKQKRFKYLECQKGNLHQGEYLNFICLDPQYDKSSLICSVCRMQKHSNHKVLPLKIFLSELSSKINQKQGVTENLDDLLENLNNIQVQMMYSLKETVEKMAQMIKQTEENLIQTYKRVKERIIAQSFMSENMPKVIDNIVNGEYSDIDLLQDECKKLINSIKVNNNVIELDFNPESVIQTFKKSQEEFIKMMNSTQDTLKQSFTNIWKVVECVPIPSQTQNIQFTYSKLLKSPSIALENKQMTAVQTQDQDQNKRFVLIEQALDLTKKTKFAFKINNLKNWVGVGIAYKKTILEKQYNFDYKSEGHGSYMISSNGLAWSHLKADNIQNKSFSFVQDDIIICELDNEAKCIKFTKKKGGQTYSLPVTFPDPKIDSLHPCVNLCNKYDKVDIVLPE